MTTYCCLHFVLQLLLAYNDRCDASTCDPHVLLLRPHFVLQLLRMYDDSREEMVACTFVPATSFACESSEPELLPQD